MPKPEKIICKTTQKTGSLVAKTKQCMTKAQWVQTELQYRQQMQEIQGKGFCGGDAPCMEDVGRGILNPGQTPGGGGGRD